MYGLRRDAIERSFDESGFLGPTVPTPLVACPAAFRAGFVPQHHLGEICAVSGTEADQIVVLLDTPR
jgi:hypothetical protein